MLPWKPACALIWIGLIGSDVSFAYEGPALSSPHPPELRVIDGFVWANATCYHGWLPLQRQPKCPLNVQAPSKYHLKDCLSVFIADEYRCGALAQPADPFSGHGELRRATSQGNPRKTLARWRSYPLLFRPSSGVWHDLPRPARTSWWFDWQFYCSTGSWICWILKQLTGE